MQDAELQSAVRRLFDAQPTLTDAVWVWVFISLVMYGILWLVRGHHEIGQLARWIHISGYQPKSTLSLAISAVGIGMFFGLLFAQIPNFPVFMGIFAFYVVADIYLWRVRRVELRRLTSAMLEEIERDSRIIEESVDGTEAEILALRKRAAQIFRHYYVEKNHYARIIGELIVALTFFVVAYYNISLPSQVIEHIPLEASGYLLLWLAVFIAEILVYRWRKGMDGGIANLERELADLKRSSR